MVRFQPIHRLNAVLVLSRQSAHLKKAAEWIRRLDRSNAAGQSLYVYRVENGKAQDLAALLNDTLGRRTADAGRAARWRRARVCRASARATQPSNPRRTSPRQARTACSRRLPAATAAATSARAAPPPSRATQPSAAPDVRIVPDEVNNLLLIKASPSEYQRIMGVLRRIDRAPLQVMINATIAEVTLNDTLRYGVQVFLKGKKFAGGHVNAPEIPLAPTYPGLNFIVGSLTDPRIVLDALASVTEVKVVSSPSVVVLDNQPALLKVGDEVPVSTQQTAAIEVPNAPIVSSIRFRDTGVILKVIPRVNSNGLVTMDIEQEISAVVPQPGGPTLTPTISQRRIASTISVYSGQMVALGGLISEQHNRDKSGLPIINRVPILGEIIGSNERGAEAHRADRLHPSAGDPRSARCARCGGGAALAAEEHVVRAAPAERMAHAHPLRSRSRQGTRPKAPSAQTSQIDGARKHPKGTLAAADSSLPRTKPSAITRLSASAAASRMTSDRLCQPIQAPATAASFTSPSPSPSRWRTRK